MLVQNAIDFAKQAASLTVWLILLSVVFLPLERIFARKGVNRRVKTPLLDLAFYYINGLLPAVLLAPFLSVLAMAAQRLSPAAYVAAVSSLPIGLKIVIGLFVGEFGTYWGHRFAHENRFMWRFHRAHHSPDSMDWLVNTRAHPLDVTFTRLCGLTPLYVFSLASSQGDGQLLPLIVSFLGTVWAFFIHANVNWRFGPLEWVVSTPAFHHWHHTNDEHRDHNYASLLPVWDWVFGSFYLPKAWPPVYGIDAPVTGTLSEQLLDPLTGP